MEFSYQQEDSSKSSSEEIDRSSEQNDDMGTGRSYECVFCKRGFTTAQALGGHMNIHRKDRANNKTKLPNFPPSSSSKVDENYSDLGFYSSINPSHVARVGGYYSSAAAPDHHHHHHHQHREDWRQRELSFYTNPLCVHGNKDKIANNSEVEDDLDLELRLGHYP